MAMLNNQMVVYLFYQVLGKEQFGAMAMAVQKEWFF
jgi:hypothetical protein